MTKHIQTSNVIKDESPYRELTSILRENGFFKKSPRRVLTELAVHTALSLGGLAIFILADNIWIQGVGFVISIYGLLGISTNTHTSSHNATTNSANFNNALTYFGYSFMAGMSAHYWQNKHCIVHHPHPNLVGIDDDVDLMPFFATTEGQFRKSRGLRYVYYRIQWLIFPFALAFNLFNLQYTGWTYLVSMLRNPKKRRAIHWLDVGLLIGHYIFWIGLPLFFFPAINVLLVYFIRNAIAGYGMFALFAPAHFPEEALFLDPKFKNKDFLFIQTATTINFRAGFLGRLLCSGVDYQIEHHLFPGISHHHYPRMSKLVKEFCRKHGYPYRVLGWGEAIWKSWMSFYHFKPLFDDVDMLARPRARAAE